MNSGAPKSSLPAGLISLGLATLTWGSLAAFKASLQGIKTNWVVGGAVALVLFLGTLALAVATLIVAVRSLCLTAKSWQTSPWPERLLAILPFTAVFILSHLLRHLI